MTMKHTLKLGCIADDFTGASDAASFLVKGGLKTVLLNGVPLQPLDVAACDAIVIALKTRSGDPHIAVGEAMKAVEWLQSVGTEHFYVKYCSTFDSTEQGNIGPVCDAVLGKLQAPYTLLCPSLPVNGRIVRDGILYVNGVPLEESPMKNHPLNPMHKSYLPDLMRPQSQYETLVLAQTELASPEVQRQLSEFSQTHEHFYVVPEYVTDDDGRHIAAQFGALAVLTGGSGLLEALAQQYAQHEAGGPVAACGTRGGALMLAGSCSAATLGQIAYFQSHGGISLKLDPAKLLDHSQTVAGIWDFVQQHHDADVLLYSSESAAYLNRIRETDLQRYANVLEETIAHLAVLALQSGGQRFTRLIVAGGETAGAVTKSLGFNAYWIGPSVAPGVPIMTPVNKTDVRIVLKSGNFGQEDFFFRALDMTKSK
jgi:uncharacterized protein YgbK (DUF1537 family)